MNHAAGSIAGASAASDRKASPRRWRLRGKVTLIQLASSPPPRRLDGRDIDLFHLHHRLECALGGGGIAIGDRLGQDDRRDLPAQSPFVLAPAALALLAAVAD